ncbi:MAG: hypothetical protein WCC62_03030 [Pseudomonas capeferrum]|nr:hypothetical protein [Pseudomonas sp. 39004]MDD1962071.1 hypothetical protein [Pseudomonas sp. 39004]
MRQESVKDLFMACDSVQVADLLSEILGYIEVRYLPLLGYEE